MTSRLFEIWSEGYRATGESGTALQHGTSYGTDFQDACDRFFEGRDDAVYYDRHHMTYWGCRLFDNEAAARETFG